MFWKRLVSWLTEINIFSNHQSFPLLCDQLLATRLFLFLFIISNLILIIFNALTLQTFSRNIKFPSFSEFEYLSNNYKSNLHCPCSQSNINYNELILFSPRLHEICSSDFIGQSFIFSLFTLNMSRYSALDFRLMGMSQFQVLISLCKISFQTINDTFKEFSSKQFYSNQILSKESFNAEMEAIIRQIKSKILVDVQYIVKFVSTVFTISRFVSALNTNYLIYYNVNTRDFYLRDGQHPIREMDPMLYNISNSLFCYCSFASDCLYPASVFNWRGRPNAINYAFIPIPKPLFKVPGMMVGCLPYISMLVSTLECFYNRSCLDLIGISSIYTPLNISLISRFPMNITIDNMFAELFIETWNNRSDFIKYYNVCAPYTCSYTYQDRQNIIYVVTSLLSIIGGLTLILCLVIPILIKLIRFVQRKYNGEDDTTTNEDKLSLITKIGQFVLSILRKLQFIIFTLNLFKSSFVNPKLGIYSTRLYIVFLIISGIILAFYSFFTTHLVTVIIEQPTQDHFDKLYSEYSSILVCPCSNLSITYNEIISIEPVYHQLCSSDFILFDRWLQYFVYDPSKSGTIDAGFHMFDFRVGNSMYEFHFMQTLCRTAEETVYNSREQFKNSQFVTSNTMSRNTFEQKTNTIIEQFQNETYSSFNALFSQLRATINDNQLYGMYDAKLQLSASVYHKRVRPYYYYRPNPSCTCAINDKCISPMGFYYRCQDCDYWDELPNKTVPGFFIGCSVLHSLMVSTLECFHDRSCLQMLIDYRELGVYNTTLSLPESITLLTPLNTSLSKRFRPNSTFEEIISNVFIEEWILSINYTNYFSHCRPVQCTYTFLEKHRALGVITTLLGLMGGLSVVLKLITPIIIKLINSIINRWSANKETLNRNNHYLKHIWHKLCTLNLFQEQSLTNEDNNHAILVTHFYLIFLFIIFSVILIFTGLNRQTHSVTIYSPSQQTFSQLYKEYSATLSCPCRYTLIQRGSFLSIDAEFHQVCSSDFISLNWRQYLWGDGYAWSFQDTQLLTSHFQVLTSLCSLARQSIYNGIQMLIIGDMLSIEVLSHDSFQMQIDSLILTFITETLQNFRRLQSFMIDAIRSNQFINIAETTWTFSFTNERENYILATIPVSTFSNNCICAASLQGCSRSLYISYYSDTITLPGLVASCLPINGLRLSTLQCFYDIQCLSNLSQALRYRYPSRNYTPRPLNASLSSIFSPTTPVSNLIDALFVERWTNSSNYSSYFSLCAPHSCSYTYVKHIDTLYMITTLIGLYGGLTLVLRFLMWHGLRIIRVYIIPIFIRRHLSTIYITSIET